MPVLTYIVIRSILTSSKEAVGSTLRVQLINTAYTLGAALMAVVSFLFLGQLFLQIGDYLTPNVDVSLYFLRRFVYQFGDILSMLIPAITALIGGGIFGGLFGNFGQTISDKISPATGKIINLVITPIAGAAIAVLLMMGIDWFYQFNNPAQQIYLFPLPHPE